MKNLLIKSLVIVSVLFLSSCGDDDESGNGYNPAILGTWELTSKTFADGNTTEITNCDDKITWQFNQDGTGVESQLQDATSGTGCQVQTATSFDYGMDVPNVFSVQIGNELTTWSYSLTDTTIKVSQGVLNVDETWTLTKQ